MIQIYAPSNKNFDMNGEVLHPEQCNASFILNGVWVVELECSFNPAIVENAVLSAPTPYGRKQLYRLKNVVKDDEISYATGYPIFLDSKNDCFLYDVRPTNKNGQEALDIMLDGSKYSAHSNITNVATSYYINKNFIEALNGNDENTFINRWGGEIAYNNYQIIVNERIGSDKGLRAEFGFNLTGIKETIDTSNVVTSIVPVAFNGRMLPDNKTVDSPLINHYPVASVKKLEYKDIKYIEDVDENEDLTGITVCNTLDELYTALRTRASAEYENEIDKPDITYDINIVDISKTDFYKDYKQLMTVNLGDTVHCKHRRLNIETSARVIEMTYDCILEEVIDLKLGDYKPTYFDRMTDNSVVIDKVVNKENQTLMADKVRGIINLLNTSLIAQKNIAQKQDVRAILFEDLDPASDTFGAMCIGTQGIQIAKQRNETNTAWIWGTAIDFKSIYAQYIITGILSDKLGNFYLDMDTGELRMKNGIFTGRIEGSQFIVTRKRTVNVTQEDKQLLRDYFEGNATLTEEQIARLDINQDGRLTAGDYLLIENISSGKISNEFTDTITIYNDGSSKIILSTTNGTQNFKTVLHTGGVEAPNIVSNNVNTDILNINSWIEFDENSQIGVTSESIGDTERDIFHIWTPNLPFYINSTPIKEPKVLASPGYYMTESQTVNLSEAITDQMSGVVLVWSAYVDGQPVDYSWFSHFISKQWIYSHEGEGISTGLMVDNEGTYAGAKYVFVSDKTIKGYSYNSADTYTGENSIKYTNKHWVLRYVIGV